MFLTFFLNKSRSYCTEIHYLITFYKIKFTKTSTIFFKKKKSLINDHEVGVSYSSFIGIHCLFLIQM
jgi:hypothetical protein